jgi:hypothetical protein
MSLKMTTMPKAVMMTTRRMIMKTTMIMITSARARVMDGHPVVAEEDLAACRVWATRTRA